MASYHIIPYHTMDIYIFYVLYIFIVYALYLSSESVTSLFSAYFVLKTRAYSLNLRFNILFIAAEAFLALTSLFSPKRALSLQTAGTNPYFSIRFNAESNCEPSSQPLNSRYCTKRESRGRCFVEIIDSSQKLVISYLCQKLIYFHH